LRISVVTPSFNQGEFIGRTIESVLSQQGDFDLEYLVVDGGSTDSTLDVLRGFGDRVRWISEADRGQSDAINKGFARGSGEVLAWLNSDDTYQPGALAAVARVFAERRAEWCFGQCRIVDERDAEVRSFIARYKDRAARRYSRARLLMENFIPQPATFFSRELWRAAGPLDERLRYAMDYDLWLRFAARGPPAYLPMPLADFRWHGGSTTASGFVASGWEGLRLAAAHARGLERLAVAGHAGSFLVQTAVYSLLAGRRGGARGG